MQRTYARPRTLAGGGLRPDINSALFAVLEERGYGGLAEGVLETVPEKRQIKSGKPALRLVGQYLGNAS